MPGHDPLGQALRIPQGNESNGLSGGTSARGPPRSDEEPSGRAHGRGRPREGFQSERRRRGYRANTVDSPAGGSNGTLGTLCPRATPSPSPGSRQRSPPEGTRPRREMSTWNPTPFLSGPRTQEPTWESPGGQRPLARAPKTGSFDRNTSSLKSMRRCFKQGAAPPSGWKLLEGRSERRRP